MWVPVERAARRPGSPAVRRATRRIVAVIAIASTGRSATEPVGFRRSGGACGGESACTPDSVEDGHPSRPAVARRLQRSTRELSGPPAPCLTLLQVGFTEPSGSPRTLVRSYRTVAPLPVRPANRTPSAVCSLWHCPAGRPDWVLPSTLPCGVRTFLGRVEARTRPSNRLTTAPRSSHVRRRAVTVGRVRRRRRCRSAPSDATRSSRRSRRRPRRTRSGRGCALV